MFCEVGVDLRFFLRRRDPISSATASPSHSTATRRAIFGVTNSHVRQNGGVTQFGRALSELNIDILCANTPQAKGRVECAHGTLQDRLVKQLRLHDISALDAANVYAAPLYSTTFWPLAPATATP